MLTQPENDVGIDLFSLGVVMYEMATGEAPFKGDTKISVITSIMRDTPLPVSDINNELPQHLGRVVNRSLAKDPDRRYQSATDLASDDGKRRMEKLVKDELTHTLFPAFKGVRSASVVGITWTTFLVR